MRRDIEFKTEDGLTLRGWHYVPDERRSKVPTIVMAHGFSAVKARLSGRCRYCHASREVIRSIEKSLID